MAGLSSSNADAETCALYARLASDDRELAIDAAAKILTIRKNKGPLACPGESAQVRQALHNQRLDVFMAALVLIAENEDAALLEPALEIAAKGRYSASMTLLAALKAFSHERQLELFRAGLDNQDPEVVVNTLWLIEQAAELAEPILTPLEMVVPLIASDDDWIHETALAHVVSAIDEHPEACEPVRETLAPLLAEEISGEEEAASGLVILAIADCRMRSLVPQLLEALDGPDDDVRGQATHALGRLGDEQAIQPLIELLFDKPDLEMFDIPVALAALDRLDADWAQRDGVPEQLQKLDRLAEAYVDAWKPHAENGYVEAVVGYCAKLARIERDRKRGDYASGLYDEPPPPEPVDPTVFDDDLVKGGDAAIVELRERAVAAAEVLNGIEDQRLFEIGEVVVGAKAIDGVRGLPGCELLSEHQPQ